MDDTFILPLLSMQGIDSHILPEGKRGVLRARSGRLGVPDALPEELLDLEQPGRETLLMGV